MDRENKIGSSNKNKIQLIAFPCLFCGGGLFNFLFIAEDFNGSGEKFTLSECAGCHIVRTSPPLSDNELRLYYSNSYYGERNKKFKAFFEKFTVISNYFRARSLIRRLPARFRQHSNTSYHVLDIGCGRATLLRMLNKLGCDCYGIERENFLTPEGIENIHFYREPIEGIGFETGFFDMTILWHSLEHLSNPVITLKEIWRILKPEGLLVIATPNFDSFQRKIFNDKWFHLDLPRHTHHFGLATLEEQLKAFGFNIMSTSTFSLEQNLYGFVQSCLNKLFPWVEPNRLYAILKKQSGSQQLLGITLWIMLAGLILPLALVEFFVTSLCRAGATAIIYAGRNAK